MFAIDHVRLALAASGLRPAPRGFRAHSAAAWTLTVRAGEIRGETRRDTGGGARGMAVERDDHDAIAGTGEQCHRA